MSGRIENRPVEKIARELFPEDQTIGKISRRIASLKEKSRQEMDTAILKLGISPFLAGLGLAGASMGYSRDNVGLVVLSSLARGISFVIAKEGAEEAFAALQETGEASLDPGFSQTTFGGHQFGGHQRAKLIYANRSTPSFD